MFGIILSVLLILYGLSLFFYCILTLLASQKTFTNIRGNSALVIVAHPDDECMFFGPLIRSLVKTMDTVYILCLSCGNHYGKGTTRKIEFRRSCILLGINPSNIYLVEHSLMSDSPTCFWRKELVGRIVKHYVETFSVQAVITFDIYGISGHVNHISLYNGLRHMCANGHNALDCKFYVLESVNLIRKYIGLLDLPLSYFWASYVYVCNFKDFIVIQKAMRAHRSQLLWFRYLYVFFSRYMLINTLKELKLESSRLRYKKEL